MNLINRLYRVYKRGEKKAQGIDDKEEPLIISRTRMTLLELEIQTLTQILSREIVNSYSNSTIPKINWVKINNIELDRLESMISTNVHGIEINPIIRPIISILRGLLDTHNKFFSGKAMPFYVKLRHECLENAHVSDENLRLPNKSVKMPVKQFLNVNIGNRTPQPHKYTRTPRNFSNFTPKIELPIKSRSNMLNIGSSTPRSTSYQTPRSKNNFRFTDTYHFMPGSEFNKKNNHVSCDQSTPRKSTKVGAGNSFKVANTQPECIIAAKALLGLSVNFPATEQDVRKAYLKAAMKWHPDKLNLSTNDKSHNCFTAIQSAMEILLHRISINGEA
ncbi:putative DNAJ protein [Cryptosporidium canis]|uniref:DNAJ protein n=1 Tax=Cryptosporidium canis TaxID=195482 RepID=A0A9D5DEA6_9CRYT|nr:putative DNAJ protein [Cryptosporidium canis]